MATSPEDLDQHLEDEALIPQFENPGETERTGVGGGQVGGLRDGEKLNIFFLDDSFEGPTAFVDKILAKVQDIHCNAFGTRIAGLATVAGSTADKKKIAPLPAIQSISAQIPRDPAKPPFFAFLAITKRQANGTYLFVDEKDIILVAMISMSKVDPSGKIEADLWSVCKNPQSNEPHAFHHFLKLHQRAEPTCELYCLFVQPDSTSVMTEYARIRLYTLCGFRFLPGSRVTLIYPSTEIWKVKSHTSASTVVLQLESDPKKEKTVYFQYIRSLPGSKDSIPMFANAETVSELNNIYDLPEIQSVAEGRSSLVIAPNLSSINIRSVGETNNGLIDINPFLPVSISQHNPGGAEDYIPICANYHQGINIRDGITETIIVPDDFIIVTFSSPGSVLGIGKENVTNFMVELSKRCIEGDIKTFIRNLIKQNRSTAVFPLTGLVNEDVFRNTFLSSEVSEPKNELTLSFNATNIIQRLGRQPILNYDYTYTNKAMKFKKAQIDIQVYTGGMRMLNLETGRDTFDYDAETDPPAWAETSAANKAVWKKSAETDDNILGLMLAYVKAAGAASGAGRRFTLEKLYDKDFTNKRPFKKLDSLLPYLQSLLPSNPDLAPIEGKRTKYILFFFGCAGVEGTSFNIRSPRNYSLLYELSHRRGLQVNKSTLDSDILFDFLLNKPSIGAVTCHPAGGGRGAPRKNSCSSRMATRFRKLRTRRVKRSKALKTRKHRGGDRPFANNLRSLALTAQATFGDAVRGAKGSLAGLRFPRASNLPKLPFPNGTKKAQAVNVKSTFVQNNPMLPKKV